MERNVVHLAEHAGIQRESALAEQGEKLLIEVTVHIDQEGAWWVAHCLELDVTTQGETFEEAKAMIQEAMQLFLETASFEEIKERITRYEKAKNAPVFTQQFELVPA